MPKQFIIGHCYWHWQNVGYLHQPVVVEPQNITTEKLKSCGTNIYGKCKSMWITFEHDQVDTTIWESKSKDFDRGNYWWIWQISNIQYFPYQNFPFSYLLTADEFVVIRLHPKVSSLALYTQLRCLDIEKLNKLHTWHKTRNVPWKNWDGSSKNSFFTATAQGAHVETNRGMRCDIIPPAFCYACTYPVATQILWLIYVYNTMHMQMHVHTTIRFSHYVAIARYA